MKNLNEQIDRIKGLMLIKEQCGGDYIQCEKDLEDKGYQVYNPSELSSTCESNNVIKCVKSVLDSEGLTGNYTIGSLKGSASDCYVLVKGVSKVLGVNRFHFSFYADNQVVISLKLDNNNDGVKLLFRGKFKCDGTDLKIIGGSTFKYIGISDSSGSKMENKEFLDSSGSAVAPSSAQMSSWGVKSPLKYDDNLNHFLNFNGIVSNVKVLSQGLSKSEIIKTIKK